MGTFIIFTDDMVGKQLEEKGRKRKLINFFEEISKDKFGTVFLPKDIGGFFDKMETVIIQLDSPTILNVGDLMDTNEKISLAVINSCIKFRKAEIKKGIVLASSEKTLEAFGKGFHLFLLDENRASGHNGQYQIINNLVDLLPLLRDQK